MHELLDMGSVRFILRARRNDKYFMVYTWFVGVLLQHLLGPRLFFLDCYKMVYFDRL